LLFFGHGPKSKPPRSNHTAIYLGNGWLIEASTRGVALGQLDWYRKSFAGPQPGSRSPPRRCPGHGELQAA